MVIRQVGRQVASMGAIEGAGMIHGGLLGSGRLWRDQEGSEGPQGNLGRPGAILVNQPPPSKPSHTSLPHLLPPPNSYLLAQLPAAMKNDKTSTWSSL